MNTSLPVHVVICGCMLFLLPNCGGLHGRESLNMRSRSINEIWDSIEKRPNDGFSDPCEAADYLVAGIFEKENILNNTEWRSKVLSKELEGFVIKSAPRNSRWNKALHNAWEPATHYTRIASRRIDRNAMVTYRYDWRGSKNYDGTKRLTTIFLSQNRQGRWFVDDIYTHDADYSQTSSFSTVLQEQTK